MSSNPAVAAAKRDLPYLLSVLGISSSKTAEMHAPCPVCGDATCLQFGPDKKNLGEWYWHCNKGCGNGNVVRALCLTRGFSGDDGWKLAYDQIEKDFNGKVSKDSPHDQYHKQQAVQRNGTGTAGTHPNAHGYVNGVVPAMRQMQLPAPKEPLRVDPVLDLDKAEKFVVQNHEYLMRNFELVKKWGRGLSKEVCEKYRIGFAEWGRVTFPQFPNKPMDIPAAWILPITNAEGDLKGVKAHFEERPYPDCPKLMWMPFGTEPAYSKTKSADGKVIEIKPQHKYTTMWPHPDTLRSQITTDFSLDPSFWIHKIPRDMLPEWNMLLEAQQLKMAWELGKTAEQLEGEELWTVQLRAFDEMKQKIFKAVLKQQNSLAVVDKKSQKQISQPDWSDYDFICPGELKALAAESVGLMATASTDGEGSIPSASFLSKFSGKKVCLFADLDPPHRSMNKKTGELIKVFCTGREWVSKWTDALRVHNIYHIAVKYGGQREREE